jgi:hypothetical protein
MVPMLPWRLPAMRGWIFKRVDGVSWHDAKHRLVAASSEPKSPSNNSTMSTSQTSNTAMPTTTSPNTMFPGAAIELHAIDNSCSSHSFIDSASTPTDTDTTRRNWVATSATSENGPHPGVEVRIPEAEFPGPAMDTYTMGPVIEERPPFEPNMEVVWTRKQRVWRWCKRHPLLAGFLLLGILTLLGWLLVGIPLIFSLHTNNVLSEDIEELGWGP